MSSNRIFSTLLRRGFATRASQCLGAPARRRRIGLAFPCTTANQQACFSSTSTNDPPYQPAPAIQPHSQQEDPPQFPPLPYHVYRTPSQELPVYQHTKNGGNLHQTRISKIEGDRAKLKDELQNLLGLKSENIRVNPINGHIIIKGWYRSQIKRFLEEKFF